MNAMAKIIYVTLLTALVWTCLPSAAQGIDVAGLERPDPQVQDQIERVVAAVVEANQGGPADAVLELVDGLERLVGDDREKLLMQLAWYLSRAQGTEQTMGAAVLIDSLAFTDEEKIRAIAPHLENDNAELRKVLVDMLSTVDRPNGGQPDFAPYRRVLGEWGDDPPPGLIRYLYDVSPGEAFLSLLLVYQDDGPERRSLALTQQAVSTTGGGIPSEQRAALVEKFSVLVDHEIWWVRLYAASMLVGRPELGAPDALPRLREDPHPLVRDAAGG